MEFLNSIYQNIDTIFSPAQLFAWVAAVFYMLAFQCQNSNKTIFIWIPADILMAFHYFFMGAPLFLVTAIAGTMRSVIALKCSRKILGIYLIAYILFLFAVFPFLVDGIKDYFAVIGTLCFCFSVWVKHNFLLHRAFAFAHQFFWLVAFVILGSYGGIVLIGFMFISNLIGTGRYILNKRNLS